MTPREPIGIVPIVQDHGQRPVAGGGVAPLDSEWFDGSAAASDFRPGLENRRGMRATTDLGEWQRSETYHSPGGIRLESRGHWWAELREDFARYRAHYDGGFIKPLLLEQGVWAMAQYRLASGIYRSSAPPIVKLPGLLFMTLLHKVIEMVTGLSVPYRADIGPGLYLGHFGPTIIHADAKIGAGCNVSQGVTIGISGRGERRGVPILGQRVFVGTHAVVCGRITLGDDVAVAANSLVTRDVEAHTTVMGSPAEVVDRRGSTGMGLHQRPASRPASPS